MDSASRYEPAHFLWRGHVEEARWCAGEYLSAGCGEVRKRFTRCVFERRWSCLAGGSPISGTTYILLIDPRMYASFKLLRRAFQSSSLKVRSQSLMGANSFTRFFSELKRIKTASEPSSRLSLRRESVGRRPVLPCTKKSRGCVNIGYGVCVEIRTCFLFVEGPGMSWRSGMRTIVF
ncbi:hypothetical protein BV25DRAFT_1527000 [Artomyces pyxidatus]|uniref:Uncharacterized protein n=1 Tax=Artomyces pyxidatus TaxID=48021 RepID=A0ACB8TD32_9AGAM|nr:hypothetical protein BV25DRAFT_1527000 [Artomyces pyxidatus]